MAFRYDLFSEAMNREAIRAYGAEQLSEKEQLVFCRMIELAQHFVMAALPYPVAREQHLPDELLERLRQTLAEVNDWQMQQAVAAGSSCVDYTVAWKSETDGSGTVVPFPER